MAAMIGVAAIAAVGAWLLLTRVAPPPKQRPTNEQTVLNEAPDKPPIRLSQIQPLTKPLMFGDVADGNQVVVEASGLDADVDAFFVLERDETSNDFVAQRGPDGVLRAAAFGLAPGTYSWSVRVRRPGATEVSRYNAPSPSFVISGLPWRLYQTDQRRQGVPHGGKSDRGFHAGVWLSGGPAEVDVEAKPQGQAFNGAGIVTLQADRVGGNAWIPLAPGQYKWRARPRFDGQPAGAWKNFSEAAEADIEIVAPSPGAQPGPPTNPPQPPPRTQPSPQAPPAPAPGTSASRDSGSGGGDGDEGGRGKSTPRPSIIKPPPKLWDLVTPLAAAAIAVAAGLSLLGAAVYLGSRGK